MSTPVLTFFNNKGGVGKTSLIYHLAWMFASLKKRVVIADLDPQSNLTAAFLDEDQIESLWGKPNPGATIHQCVKPLSATSDPALPQLQPVNSHLYLLPGDVALSRFEELLSKSWSSSLGTIEMYRSIRILTAFWQVVQMAASTVKADIVLVDIGPNLGAINRSVLLATDYVAIPLGADLFSLQGLRNLGPTLKFWKEEWRLRVENWKRSPEYNEFPVFNLPVGTMKPIGYLCQQHGVRMDRPVKAYDKWVNRVPEVYRETVLNEPPVIGMTPTTDPYCLATIKHYRSLVPMGQEHRKPIFSLTSADGAIGAHANAVLDAKKDFRELAGKIADQMGIPL